jgi:glycogen debranching enzyme
MEFEQEQTKTLMSGDLFAVFDRRGDFCATASNSQGLFYREMRHLSKLTLRLEEGALRLLTSSYRLDNAVLSIDQTNTELQRAGQKILNPGVLYFSRSLFAWLNGCYQHLEIHNYGGEALAVELVLEFEADFADIFEVRGHQRERRGKLLEPLVTESTVSLGYLGLDGLRRDTRIEVSGSSAAVSGDQIRVPIRLGPGEQTNLNVRVKCSSGKETSRFPSAQEAVDQLEKRGQEIARVEIQTSNERFNHWVSRSVADLRMLVVQTREGLYPYAGVPWFSTVFGRDGIITSLECLWFCPEIAQGVLSHLASTQATEIDPGRDAEPGKILHEARQSEMALLGEVPYHRYYGSVDSTPLFILLAAAYFKRTGDRELLARLWPNIERALHWIDHYGDRDADGFIEYGRQTSRGLLQQGWKDSPESIFHADRSIANGPIALCEVQAYVYAAKREMADVCFAFGRSARAEELRREADSLKRRFHEAFWCEEISSYAIALDGNKQKCQIRSSNAGHALFTGIASDDHAERIIRELGSAKYFSGWGIRTIAIGEARYNPLAYHNGSIWPHDNALIAFGLSRRKNKDLAGRVLVGLFEASTFMELGRLPELFAGVSRRQGYSPTLCPNACSPQAWAAGAVFLLLQACLGMEIMAVENLVRFVHPQLPDAVPEIRLQGLKVGSGLLDLELIKRPQTVDVAIIRRIGNVEVEVIP